MAIDKRKLKNLFGNAPDEEVQDSQEESKDFFDDDSDNENYEFTIPENDEDLLPAAPIIRNPDAKPITEQSVVADVNYARDAQNDLINQSQRLIQIALENASNGGTARDIEVASNAILNAAKVVEGLLNIHEKRTKLSSEQPNVGSGNTFVQNQIVYQGTTSEAMKALREGTINIDDL